MIHIITGDSATGALNHAFHGSDHQIYALPLDFSVGPIKAIHEEEGIQRHVEWLDSSFSYEDDYAEYQGKVYRQSVEKLKNLHRGEELTVWTCDNAAEQIGLRLVCYLTAGKGAKLAAVNTAEAMDEMMRGSDVQIEIRHSGECNGEQLAHFYEHSRIPLPESAVDSLAEQMKPLLSSVSLLRSWKNDEILEAEETRDDEFILDCVREQEKDKAKESFVKAARVVGEVLGHSYHIYSDAWIDYRIRSLIHSGQLVSRGDIGSMRTYDVQARETEY